MANDNHEEERVKWCPLLNEYCIKEKCAFQGELQRKMGGIQQKFSMCGIQAIIMLLSEINSKTQGTPSPKIQLPNDLYRR